MLDQRLLDRTLEGEVEVLQCLLGGELGGADAQLTAGGLP